MFYMSQSEHFFHIRKDSAAKCERETDRAYANCECVWERERDRAFARASTHYCSNELIPCFLSFGYFVQGLKTYIIVNCFACVWYSWSVCYKQQHKKTRQQQHTKCVLHKLTRYVLCTCVCVCFSSSLFVCVIIVKWETRPKCTKWNHDKSKRKKKKHTDANPFPFLFYEWFLWMKLKLSLW